MADESSALTEVKNSEHLDEILKHQGLVVLHFYTDWSDPCKQVNDALLDLAQELAHVKFAKVAAEVLAEISLKYKIIAVPTVLFVKGGQVVDRVNGVHIPEIARKSRSHGSTPFLSSTALSSAAAPQEKEDLESRLKRLVNHAPCMLFMKGTPQEPRCGFSRQIVQILNEINAEFSSFDILSDEEVRQGLKKFSDWPTYPQLYVKGELVGGLDIVKEMMTTGELEPTIPKKKSLEDRLRSLIHQSPVMLFMKGEPSQPRCGFSRSICEILNGIGIQYSTFDILTDSEVRQGLKKFSDWPTYPQLYVNGELIGGLDIVKEMQEAGELMNALKGNS